MKIRMLFLLAALVGCEDHRYEMDHCKDMCAPRRVKSFTAAPNSALGVGNLGCICDDTPCPADKR